MIRLKSVLLSLSLTIALTALPAHGQQPGASPTGRRVHLCEAAGGITGAVVGGLGTGAVTFALANLLIPEHYDPGLFGGKGWDVLGWTVFAGVAGYNIGCATGVQLVGKRLGQNRSWWAALAGSALGMAAGTALGTVGGSAIASLVPGRAGGTTRLILYAGSVALLSSAGATLGYNLSPLRHQPPARHQSRLGLPMLRPQLFSTDDGRMITALDLTVIRATF